MKVFLGGTKESNWRNQIIPMLDIDYFNPVVDNCSSECIAEELRQRKECDIRLYVITPKMTDVSLIAELVDDSNKRSCRTVFVRLREDESMRFTDEQWASLNAVAQIIEGNACATFDNLESAAQYLNAITMN
jgi:hypothetical protein